MDVLALDLSKASTGWARWAEGQPRPTFGSKTLGSTGAPRGDVYVALHKLFLEFQLFGAPDFVVFESPQDPKHLPYPTKFMNDRLLIGIAEMVYYFSTMIGVRQVREVNNQAWWIPFNRQPMIKRTSGISVKDVTIARCRQLGFKVRNSDEADALGLLDYELEARHKVTPPWRTDEVLFAPSALAQ